MELPNKEILWLFGIVISGLTSSLVTFLSTKHKIKEYTRDKLDAIQKEANDKISDLKDKHAELERSVTKVDSKIKIELNNLKNKDELQQNTIDKMGESNDEIIPRLFEIIKLKAN